mmetsp:Transcript_97846/g.262942  ORF Transcript_97846/g.262942 Transcript_97846/m.262942 type:complete len:358 (-) Transcript_97846:100-1173(-)
MIVRYVRAQAREGTEQRGTRRVPPGLRSRVAAHATEHAALDQGGGGLLLEDAERLLAARQLGLEAGLALLMGLRLRDAIALDLRQVLEHGIQLRLHPGAIRSHLRGRLVKRCGLLALVLHVLLLGNALDVVLLGLPLVVRGSRLLCGSDLNRTLGEVRLADLQKTDDAAARTGRGSVGLVLGRVVLVQDLESSLDTLQALIEVCLVLHERLVLLTANHAHLSLSRSESRELILQLSDLLLELSRSGRSLVDLGAQLLGLRSLLRLLGIGLRQLLVTISLFGGIHRLLALQLRDHIREQALDLGEGVARVHRGGNALRELREHRGALLAREVTDHVNNLEALQVGEGRELRPRGDLQQ